MAIFKAEDVAVSIDGVGLAASTLSLDVNKSLVEDRRLGKNMDEQGFVPNGPQTSSMSVSFYVTGDATGDCPIFSLLNGGDAYSVNLMSGITGYDEIVGKTFKKRYAPEITGAVYEYIGNYYAYALRYDSYSDIILIWRGDLPIGYWSSGNNVFGTHDYATYEAFLTVNLEEFYDSGLNLFVIGTSQSGVGTVTRRGFLDCMTGSTISLGGQKFASGAALTYLGFSMEPFSPVLCNATFEIYNPISSSFPSGNSSLSIDPANIAHGLYSYYSGVTGISEVSSINWELTAERAPRYVVGERNVHEIKTTKAYKRMSFEGWSDSSQVIPDPPDQFIISLGSSAGTVYLDSISGTTTNGSFNLPDVGIMSKNFTIVQNLL